MTREERINSALLPILEKMREHGVTDEMCKMYDNGFHVGAMWADAHPHWISVEDELPKNKELVFITDGEYTDTGFYEYTFDEWQPCEKWLGDITHWMPLPQAPLVTDLNKKDLPPVSWQEGNILVEEEGGEKMDFFTWKERYEYYRTKGYEQGYEDAINKACEWIEENYPSLDGHRDWLIEQFRKAMKGE